MAEWNAGSSAGGVVGDWHFDFQLKVPLQKMEKYSISVEHAVQISSES